MKTLVVYEPWRPRPLAWIHRGEARSVAAELHAAGHDVALVCLRDDLARRTPAERLLLRLSDPTMHRATKAFAAAGVPYVGPDAAVMERCYDKFEAGRQVAAAGIHCPETALADDAVRIAAPRILKPRRGSDSIGVRLLGDAPVPPGRRNEAHIVQDYVRGTELTVAVLRGEVGVPLRIELPEGVPYSFLRKYLLRPARGPVGDAALAQRVRSIAAQVSRVLGVDWAARIDLMHERGTGRLVFLECDVAPLVSADSAFAASLAAGGMDRRRQLQGLLGEAS